MKKKAFRKLKRLELVELLYQLRKENIELRKRNKNLAQQLEKSESIVAAYAGRTDDEQLERIEQLLKDILRASSAPVQEAAEETVPEAGEEAVSEEESADETGIADESGAETESEEE